MHHKPSKLHNTPHHAAHIISSLNASGPYHSFLTASTISSAKGGLNTAAYFSSSNNLQGQVTTLGMVDTS